jgi:hypothetical protein
MVVCAGARTKSAVSALLKLKFEAESRFCKRKMLAARHNSICVHDAWHSAAMEGELRLCMSQQSEQASSPSRYTLCMCMGAALSVGSVTCKLVLCVVKQYHSNTKPALNYLTSRPCFYHLSPSCMSNLLLLLLLRLQWCLLGGSGS